MRNRLLLVILASVFVLYPPGHLPAQTSQRGGSLPECLIATLQDGTCIPAKVGNRARITDGANTEDCSTGNGSSINLCERTSAGTWSVPTYVGGAGDATLVNGVASVDLDLTDNTSIAFTNAGGSPNVVTASVVDDAITTAKLNSADTPGTSQFLRTTAGAASAVEFLTAAEVAAAVDSAASNATPLTWNVTPATCTGDGNGGTLTVNGSDEIVCAADDGSGGATEWTDTASVIHLTTPTDDLAIGASTPPAGAKAGIDGDEDEVQLAVQGNATQTADILVVEDSTGADKLAVSTTVAELGVQLDMQTNDITGVGTITADNIVSAGTPFTQDVQCITVEDPVDADNFLFFRADAALTVTGIDCLVNAATQVTTVQECDANGANCVAVEAAITCAATNTTEAAAIDNAAIDSGDWVRLDVGAGTVSQLSVCVTFERG